MYTIRDWGHCINVSQYKPTLVSHHMPNLGVLPPLPTSWFYTCVFYVAKYKLGGANRINLILLRQIHCFPKHLPDRKWILSFTAITTALKGTRNHCHVMLLCIFAHCALNKMTSILQTTFTCLLSWLNCFPSNLVEICSLGVIGPHVSTGSVNDLMSSHNRSLRHMS